MSSFVIELDTTQPIIEVNAPSYSTPSADTEVVISSNEKLAEYQDIYFIDGSGKKHELTFSFSEMGYTGVVVFSNYSLGIGLLYATLKDEVFNLSNLAYKAINIIPAERLTLETEQKTNELKTKETVADFVLTAKERKIEDIVLAQEVTTETTEKVQEVEIQAEVL